MKESVVGRFTNASQGQENIRPEGQRIDYPNKENEFLSQGAPRSLPNNTLGCQPEPDSKTLVLKTPHRFVYRA